MSLLIFRSASVSPRARSRHGGVEALESRIAPATVAPGNFTYTDADGDAIKIQILGKGTVDFLDKNGGDVSVTGLDIAKIEITKPSADFALLVSDTNDTLLDDGVIKLGVISGPAGARLPVIKGVFTAASTPGVSYELGGFIGTSFSSGGGLKILGALTGDASATTTDLDLKSLAALNSVTFKDGIAAGAKATISGVMAGTFTTSNVSGDLTFGTLSGTATIEHIIGNAVVTGNVSGLLKLGETSGAPGTVDEFTIQGLVTATAHIITPQSINLHVTKNFSGHLSAGEDIQIDVTGDLQGATLAAGSDLTFDITGQASGSSLLAGQKILNGSKVGKGATSSQFLGAKGVDIEINGNATRCRISGGQGELDAHITGSSTSSQFLSGGDAFVDVDFSLISSSVLADGRLQLTVGSLPTSTAAGIGEARSSLLGSKSDQATIEVGGRVISSQLTAATDLTVTTGTYIQSGVLEAGNNLNVTSAGSVLTSRFVAGSDANVTVGGQVASSAFLISNNLTAKIGNTGVPVVLQAPPQAGVTGSRFETSDGSLDITVVGPMSGTLFESGQDAKVDVSDVVGLDPKTSQPKIVKPGTVSTSVFVVTAGDESFTSHSGSAVGARISADGDADVTLPGLYNGSISATKNVNFQAGSANFSVLKTAPPILSAGSVPAPPAPATTSGTTTTTTVAIPSIPGSGNSVLIAARTGLRVGGDLSLNVAGSVAAALIDVTGDLTQFSVGGGLSAKIYVGGDFATGALGVSTVLVGGIVAPTTVLHVSGNFGDAVSASEYVFSMGFGGRLEIGGDLQVDLTFNASVNRIDIDGVIAPAGTNLIADIIVKGTLSTFNSASLFQRTSLKGGDFKDASGATVGTLTADVAATTVGPFAA